MRMVKQLRAATSVAMAAFFTASLLGSAQAAPDPAPTPAAPLCSQPYLDDERLGPADLPRPDQQTLEELLVDYRRTGSLSPEQFLDKYWDSSANSWIYPPHDGFAANPDGELDKHRKPLRVGQELDRFGSEFGSFLAPSGDRYAQRSLPPQSLMTRNPGYPCGYHSYEVTKPFTVWQGRIAEWFEQPGHGQQILLDARFLRPGPGEKLNVKWLLEHDYLEPDDNTGTPPQIGTD